MFEDYGHIHVHVYSPGVGADNLLGPKYFHKHKSSVHLLISSKFSAIKPVPEVIKTFFMLS